VIACASRNVENSVGPLRTRRRRFMSSSRRTLGLSLSARHAGQSGASAAG